MGMRISPNHGGNEVSEERNGGTPGDGIKREGDISGRARLTQRKVMDTESPSYTRPVVHGMRVKLATEVINEVLAKAGL